MLRVGVVAYLCEERRGVSQARFGIRAGTTCAGHKGRDKGATRSSADKSAPVRQAFLSGATTAWALSRLGRLVLPPYPQAARLPFNRMHDPPFRQRRISVPPLICGPLLERGAGQRHAQGAQQARKMRAASELQTRSRQRLYASRMMPRLSRSEQSSPPPPSWHPRSALIDNASLSWTISHKSGPLPYHAPCPLSRAAAA